MYPRLLVIGLLAACFSGCTDDPTTVRAGNDAGPGFAGSCNFEDMQTCEEYAEADAKAETAGGCTNTGGTWTGGKCPLAKRSAVCTAGTAGTRTYAYGAAAAATLKSTCPAGKFVSIADPSGGGAGGTGAGGTGTGGSGTGGTGSGGTGDDGGANDQDAGL